MSTNIRIPNRRTPRGMRSLAHVFWLVTLLLAVGAATVGLEWAVGAKPLLSLPQAEVASSSSPMPWYGTPWALAAYGVGLLGVFAFCLRCRSVQLSRQRDELEEVLQRKTSEVEAQKKQLETYNQELLRTNEALRKTVEEKSKLLGMAAHDLKNPLFGIRALSEIVLESGELSTKHTRKLNLIRESADDTLHLIDDLLTTAASSVQSEASLQPVDVAALAQWVVRSFAPHAERKDQTLRCTVATEAPCVVEGDKQKLREAIDNLVSNALKYSPPGEAVAVRVDRQEGAVRVAVEDDGPGLSESDQQRMFAPFQRLTPTPTGEEGASGLGLYIVKRIVEGHDGRVEVDTALGEGSTFSLVLPATPSTTPPVPKANPQEVEVSD